MIEFNAEEEKSLLRHYADKFQNTRIIEIMDKGVKSSEDANILSKFYRDMIKQTVVDEENGDIFSEDLDYHLEKLVHLLGGYLRANGYEKEWNNRGI